MVKYVGAVVQWVGFCFRGLFALRCVVPLACLLQTACVERDEVSQVIVPDCDMSHGRCTVLAAVVPTGVCLHRMDKSIVV